MARTASETVQILRHSKIAEFLSPTLQKKAYHLLAAIVLGLTFVFVYLGSIYNNHLLSWLALSAFLALSFPSLLLVQGYGLEPLSNLGAGTVALAIFLEALWLYLLACTLHLLLQRKGKGEK